MKLIKIEACTSCYSHALLYVDCICSYQNGYPTIELEFEECECCGVISTHYADTEFNKLQLEKYEGS